MNEERIVRKVFTAIPDRKRATGKPKTRWKDCIKMCKIKPLITKSNDIETDQSSFSCPSAGQSRSSSTHAPRSLDGRAHSSLLVTAANTPTATTPEDVSHSRGRNVYMYIIWRCTNSVIFKLVMKTALECLKMLEQLGEEIRQCLLWVGTNGRSFWQR